MTAKAKGKKKPIEMFESALKIFWGGQFEEAMAAFEKIRNESSDHLNLTDRVDTYISVCRTRLGEKDLKPRNAGDHYFYGVVQLNEGRINDSIKHLKKAVEKENTNDAWLFTLACAHALNGNNEEALANLENAIKINDDNRFYAHNCPDFAQIKSDSKFRQLLELEI